MALAFDRVRGSLASRGTRSPGKRAVQSHAYRAREIFPPGREQAADSVKKWRRGRDSNPWKPFGFNGFQDRRLKPLGHLSVTPVSTRAPITRSCESCCGRWRNRRPVLYGCRSIAGAAGRRAPRGPGANVGRPAVRGVRQGILPVIFTSVDYVHRPERPGKAPIHDFRERGTERVADSQRP